MPYVGKREGVQDKSKKQNGGGIAVTHSTGQGLAFASYSNSPVSAVTSPPSFSSQKGGGQKQMGPADDVTMGICVVKKKNKPCKRDRKSDKMAF